MQSTLHDFSYDKITSYDVCLWGIQKLIFLDTAEGVATALRPYWAEATEDRANVVQAVPDMLEIVPSGTSKGSGVKLLLDHLEIAPKEVLKISQKSL